MKHLVLLAGLVMAAAVCSCTSKGKTSLEINGKTVRVDTFTANHYTKFEIGAALARDSVVRKVKKPTSAADFGKKKYAIEWKAVNHKLEANGTVTVIHYEKGVEIVKDGKSWFYDFANFRDDDCQNGCWSAAESVLYPGVWEPTGIIVSSIAKNLIFSYMYTCKSDKYEVFGFFPYEYEEKNISSIEDLIVGRTEY